MSLEELEAGVRKLSLEERAALVQRIVGSPDELERGAATEVSAEDVLRRARPSLS